MGHCTGASGEERGFDCGYRIFWLSPTPPECYYNGHGLQSFWIGNRAQDKHRCEAPQGTWADGQCIIPQPPVPSNEYACTNSGTWSSVNWNDFIVSQTCEQPFFTDQQSCETKGEWAGTCVATYTDSTSCNLKDEHDTISQYPKNFAATGHDVQTLEQCHIYFMKQRDLGETVTFEVLTDNSGCRHVTNAITWGGGTCTSDCVKISAFEPIDNAILNLTPEWRTGVGCFIREFGQSDCEAKPGIWHDYRVDVNCDNPDGGYYWESRKDSETLCTAPTGIWDSTLSRCQVEDVTEPECNTLGGSWDDQCETFHYIDDGGIQCKTGEFTNSKSCTTKGDWRNTCVLPYYTKMACGGRGSRKDTSADEVWDGSHHQDKEGTVEIHWDDPVAHQNGERWLDVVLCEQYQIANKVKRASYFTEIDDDTKTIGCFETSNNLGDQIITFNHATSCTGSDCSCTKTPNAQNGFIFTCLRLKSNWASQSNRIDYYWDDDTNKCMYTRPTGASLSTNGFEVPANDPKYLGRGGFWSCNTDFYLSDIPTRNASKDACEEDPGVWDGTTCSNTNYDNELECITQGSWVYTPATKEVCEGPAGTWNAYEKRCEGSQSNCDVGIIKGECYEGSGNTPRIHFGGREFSLTRCETEALAWIEERSLCYHHEVKSQSECNDKGGIFTPVGETRVITNGREINEVACKEDPGVWVNNRCEFQDLSKTYDDEASCSGTWRYGCFFTPGPDGKFTDAEEEWCDYRATTFCEDTRERGTPDRPGTEFDTELKCENAGGTWEKACYEIDQNSGTLDPNKPWSSFRQACLNKGHNSQFEEDCYNNYATGALLGNDLRSTSNEHCNHRKGVWTDEPLNQPFKNDENTCFYEDITQGVDCTAFNTLGTGVWNDGDDFGHYDPTLYPWRLSFRECAIAAYRTGRCYRGSPEVDITFEDRSKTLYHIYDCEYAGGRFVHNEWDGPTDWSLSYDMHAADLTKPNGCYLEGGTVKYNPTYDSNVRCSSTYVCLKHSFKGVCFSQYGTWLTGLRGSNQTMCEGAVGEWNPSVCTTYGGNRNPVDLSGGRELSQETCEAVPGIWENDACVHSFSSSSLFTRDTKHCTDVGEYKEYCHVPHTDWEPYTEASCKSGTWTGGCFFDSTTSIYQALNSPDYDTWLTRCQEYWIEAEEEFCERRDLDTQLKCENKGGFWGGCQVLDSYNEPQRVGGPRRVSKQLCEAPMTWDSNGFCHYEFIETERACNTVGVWENDKCNIGEVGWTQEMCEAPAGNWVETCENSFLDMPCVGYKYTNKEECETKGMWVDGYFEEETRFTTEDECITQGIWYQAMVSGSTMRNGCAHPDTPTSFDTAPGIRSSWYTQSICELPVGEWRDGKCFMYCEECGCAKTDEPSYVYDGSTTYSPIPGIRGSELSESVCTAEPGVWIDNLNGGKCVLPDATCTEDDVWRTETLNISTCGFKGEWAPPRCLSGQTKLTSGRDTSKTLCEAAPSDYGYCSKQDRGRGVNRAFCEAESPTKWVETCTAGGKRGKDQTSCEKVTTWSPERQYCAGPSIEIKKGRHLSEEACEKDEAQWDYCSVGGNRDSEEACEAPAEIWTTCSCSENNDCTEGKVCEDDICNDPPACTVNPVPEYCSCDGIAKPGQYCHGYIADYPKCTESEKTNATCSCADSVDCAVGKTCIGGSCLDACSENVELQSACACGNGMLANAGQYCYGSGNDAYVSDVPKCSEFAKVTQDCECGDSRFLVLATEYCHGTYSSLFPKCSTGEKCHCTETKLCPTGYNCNDGTCELPDACPISPSIIEHRWERDLSKLYKSPNKYCVCNGEIIPPGEFCYDGFSSPHLPCSVYRNDVREYDSCRETYLTTEECNAQNRKIEIDYSDAQSYMEWLSTFKDEHWRKERCPNSCLETESAIGDTCFAIGGTQGSTYECTNVATDASWGFGYTAPSGTDIGSELSCGSVSAGDCANVSPPPAFDISGCDHETFRDNLYVNDFNFINPYDFAMSAGGAKPYGFRLKLHNLAEDDDIISKLGGSNDITRDGVTIDKQNEKDALDKKGYTDFMFEKPLVIAWSDVRLTGSIIDNPSQLEPLPFKRDFTLNEKWQKNVEDSDAKPVDHRIVQTRIAEQGQLEKLEETPTGISAASFDHQSGKLEGCVIDNDGVSVRRIAYKSANKALLIDLKGTLKAGETLMLKCYFPDRLEALPVTATYQMNYNYGLKIMSDFDLQYDYSVDLGFGSLDFNNKDKITNKKLDFAPVTCEKAHSSYTLYGYLLTSENNWNSDSLDISVKCATSMGYHGKSTWDGSGDNIQVYSCAGELNEKIIQPFDNTMFEGFDDSLAINALLGVVPVGCEIGRAIPPTVVPRGYKLEGSCTVFTSEKSECCGCTKYSTRNQFDFYPTFQQSFSSPPLRARGYCPPQDGDGLAEITFGKAPPSFTVDDCWDIPHEGRGDGFLRTFDNDLSGCYQQENGIIWGEGTNRDCVNYQCIEKRDGQYHVGPGIMTKSECYHYWYLLYNGRLSPTDSTLTGGCQKYGTAYLYNYATSDYECSDTVPCMGKANKEGDTFSTLEECDNFCADHDYKYFAYKDERCICTLSDDKSLCVDWNMDLNTYQTSKSNDNSYFGYEDDSCKLNSQNFCAANWYEDVADVQCSGESWFSDNNFNWNGAYQPTFSSWTEESSMKHVYLDFTEDKFQPNNPISWGEYTFQGCVPPQIWELKQGWNWVSVGVKLRDPSLSSLQGFETGDRIVCQGSRGEATYYGSNGWAGSLKTLKHLEMCKVHVQSDKNIEIYGSVSSSPQISFQKGWNWIGFPTNETTLENDILVNELDMEFNINDRFKCQDSNELAINSGHTWYDGGNPSELVIQRNRGCTIYKENEETKTLGGMADFGKTWI